MKQHDQIKNFRGRLCRGYAWGHF